MCDEHVPDVFLWVVDRAQKAVESMQKTAWPELPAADWNIQVCSCRYKVHVVPASKYMFKQEDLRERS